MDSFLGGRRVNWRRVTVKVRAVWLLLLSGSFTS
jgi:hypothetical protein